MDSEVKTDDKFCINISYKHEEDEKFYVFFDFFFKFWGLPRWLNFLNIN